MLKKFWSVEFGVVLIESEEDDSSGLRANAQNNFFHRVKCKKIFHDTKKELPNIVIAKWNPNGLYLLDSFGYWIETPTTLRGWSLNKKRWKKSGLRANTQNFWIDAEKRTTGAERRSWKKDRCWKKNKEFHFQNVEDYNVLIDALENGQIRSIELDNFIFKCRRLKCSDRCWKCNHIQQIHPIPF